MSWRKNALPTSHHKWMWIWCETESRLHTIKEYSIILLLQKVTFRSLLFLIDTEFLDNIRLRSQLNLFSLRTCCTLYSYTPCPVVMTALSGRFFIINKQTSLKRAVSLRVAVVSVNAPMPPFTLSSGHAILFKSYILSIYFYTV